MKKLKLFLQKPFVKNYIAPIVRGLVKQVPLVGTPIVEVVSNITQPNKHKWLSITVQIVCAIVILYAFYTKAITVQEVLDYLKQYI